MTIRTALVACETSGRVRDALRTVGVDAVSCDLLPTLVPGPHIQGDARMALRARRWDLLIAHPVCATLTVAAAWCLYHPDDRDLPAEQRRPHPRYPDRKREQDEAAEFFMVFAEADHIPHRAIENPVGVMSTRYRAPDQIVQPYQFGDDASKKTCLWLFDLEPLKLPPRERWFPPRMVWDASRKKHLPRWSNQTDSGQNRLAPSADRWAERSKTYPGIAAAMATDWGCI